MRELIGAFTKSDPLYPGYVNVSREGGEVILTVRGDPSSRDATYICGYAPRDKGQLGRCTPGDEHCNNYCNCAPQKGPMQDRPKPCVQVVEAKTVTLTLTETEFRHLRGAIRG